VSTVFDHTSRYYGLEVVTTTPAGGRPVSYVRRRFLPRGDALPLLAEVAVAEDERIDLVAHRTLGDPLAWWRVADANDVMDPQQLTREPGVLLRIPMPLGPGS
jgi:hypothetical protein